MEPWARLSAVLSELPVRLASASATGPPDLSDLLPDSWLKSHPEHRWTIDDVHDVDTDNGQRSIRSVNCQKRYKERDSDEVKYTTSFGLAELPLVMRVLMLATQHVESKEARLELND